MDAGTNHAAATLRIVAKCGEGIDAEKNFDFVVRRRADVGGNGSRQGGLDRA
jgi:hypothetical protein